MADVSMPRLSDSMEEGTILKWLKSDGDEVKRGDELVEIETDKANMTYEADQDGVLSISASEGDTLAVGEKIAGIGEAVAEEPQQEEAQPAAEEEQAEAEPEAEPEPEVEQPETEQQDEERRTEEEHEEEQPSEAPAHEPVAEESEAEPEPVAEEPEPEPEPEAAEENGRIRASPIARRMA